MGEQFKRLSCLEVLSGYSSSHLEEIGRIRSEVGGVKIEDDFLVLLLILDQQARFSRKSAVAFLQRLEEACNTAGEWRFFIPMSPDYQKMKGGGWILGTGEEKPATFSVATFIELMRNCGLRAESFFPVLVDLCPEVPLSDQDFQRNLRGVERALGSHGVQVGLLSDFVGEDFIKQVEGRGPTFKTDASRLLKQAGVLTHLRRGSGGDVLTQIAAVMALYEGLGNFCRRGGMVIVDCQAREYPGQQSYYGNNVARVRIGDDLHRRLYGV